MINPFPVGCNNSDRSEDFNPAIRLFGRRFSNDQQMLDLLAEFLLVVASPKKTTDTFDDSFPEMTMLQQWKAYTAHLIYYPKSRLNLKLFAFLSSSRLETRHPAHRQHGDDLWHLLRERVDLETVEEKNEFLKTLSLLFLGFWGNGAQRTWCAQTFFPFCRGVLGGDVIWNETMARRKSLSSWDSIIQQFSIFFDTNKHRFLARGGESLYLQICNALLQAKPELDCWLAAHTVEDATLGLTTQERDPIQLHAALKKDFKVFFGLTPKMLSEVMDFVDSGVDAESAQKSDYDRENPRGVKCGWVPQESWREGYLFAVELHRILSANIGIMETVELMQIACALQVMRSLAAQSYRHSQTPGGMEDGFDYRILICDSCSRKCKVKTFSAQSHAEIAREIQQAIRIPEIKNDIEFACSDKASPEKDFDKTYKEADAYGFKLYRKIGKSIGLIVPPTGGRMRYTLNDKLLKYLVVAMMPQERMTLDTFKKQIELHHGFVFSLKELQVSRNWKERGNEFSGADSSDSYLEQMLEASGVLVHLSDSCSLVKNPYVALQEEGV